MGLEPTPGASTGWRCRRAGSGAGPTCACASRWCAPGRGSPRCWSRAGSRRRGSRCGAPSPGRPPAGAPRPAGARSGPWKAYRTCGRVCDVIAPVRPVRVLLESTLSPFEVLRALRSDSRPFALVGAWAGGGAVLGSEPVRVAPADADPFALLDVLPEVADAPAGMVGGGWFGYLGYSLGERVERLPPSPPRPYPLPAFSLAYYDHVLRLDADGGWWFESMTEDHPRLPLLRERLAAPAPASKPYELGPFRAYPGRAAHTRAVEWCRRYIAAGDLYQANLCLRLDAGFEGDPLDLFCAAAGELAPDRAAYLAGPWGALASLSP